MIVKCQFKQNDTKDYGGRMYTYMTDLPLKVGDIVRVPAGAGEGIARVTETDVPEHTVDANLFRVLKHVVGFAEYEDTLFNDAAEPEETTALATTEIPSDIIVIQQLPVLEEHIRSLKPIIEGKVDEAMSLAVTEDTAAAVRKVRAALNRDCDSFKKSVKEVIDAVSAPLIPIKEARDEILKIYEKADRDLAIKINTVDDGVKDEKRKQLQAFYEEYRKSKSLDAEEMADFSRFPGGSAIRKSDSLTALKKKAEEHLNKIEGDLIAIGSGRYPDEILVEYRRLGDLARATANVNERHRLAEEARKLREAAAAEKAEREAREREARAKVEEALRNAEPLSPPKPEEAPVPVQAQPEQIFTATFKVYGTKTQLKKLKEFMIQEGIRYGK